MKSRVVGNLNTSSNGSKTWDSNVGQLRVGDKCQTSATGCWVTNSGQIWCGKAGEEIVVEDQRSVNLGQGWNADFGDISESHIVGPDKVREADLQVSSIGCNVYTLSDVTNLGAEGSQAVVVVDIK